MAAEEDQRAAREYDTPSDRRPLRHQHSQPCGSKQRQRRDGYELRPVPARVDKREVVRRGDEQQARDLGPPAAQPGRPPKQVPADVGSGKPEHVAGHIRDHDAVIEQHRQRSSQRVDRPAVESVEGVESRAVVVEEQTRLMVVFDRDALTPDVPEMIGPVLTHAGGREQHRPREEGDNPRANGYHRQRANRRHALGELPGEIPTSSSQELASVTRPAVVAYAGSLGRRHQIDRALRNIERFGHGRRGRRV